MRKAPPAPDISGLRRSTRLTTGKRITHLYHDVFLAQEPMFEGDGNQYHLCYLAELGTHIDSGDVDIIDPPVYVAKHTNNDPDSPSMHDALHGDFVEQYYEAMKVEIHALAQQKTCKLIPRGDVGRLIKSTWVFKLKRLPDGTHLKFKA
jgi:hypothetical protein